MMTSPPRALVVEDTGSIAFLYKKLLEREGFEVEIACDPAVARQRIDSGNFQLYVLDLVLVDWSGLELLKYAKNNTPDIPAIVLTADGSINRAIEAMRIGAFDFMVKPFSEALFVNAALNAIAKTGGAVKAAAAVEVVETSDNPSKSVDFYGFVGESPAMMNIYERIKSVGPSTATVFITGESGTGKEVCADALHRISGRAKKPFVALNCGAIPAELLESEVFGHLKGSFTGAIADKLGAAREADGGTLFLDEICELPLSLQTKLLRFLQTSTVTPVGSSRALPVDVRILCATNRDPTKEVREGRFREDLFFRLHVVPAHLPPLHERGSDILLLARHFLRKFAEVERKGLYDFTPEACAQLMGMRWQGNVRQLENMMRMIAAVYDGPLVTLEMLPPEIDTIRDEGLASSAKNCAPDPAVDTVDANASIAARVSLLLGEELAEVEKALIEETISSCDGSISKAARILNVSPSTIYRKKEAWAKQDHGPGTNAHSGGAADGARFGIVQSNAPRGFVRLVRNAVSQ